MYIYIYISMCVCVFVHGLGNYHWQLAVHGKKKPRSQWHSCHVDPFVNVVKKGKKLKEIGNPKRNLTVFSEGENYGFLPRRIERNLFGCCVRRTGNFFGGSVAFYGEASRRNFQKISGEGNSWGEVEHVNARPHFCYL